MRAKKMRRVGPEACPKCNTLMYWTEIEKDRYYGSEAHVCKGGRWAAATTGRPGKR